MSKLIMKLAAWRSQLASRQQIEQGAVAVEYGVLAGTVAVVLIVGVTVFFGELSDWFSDLVDLLPIPA